MQFLATYLKLAQEFGGTEFGPYEDLEISLGSQQASVNIFIPPNFGVLPVHAKLIRKSATDVVLAPAEQSAEIYLWKGRSRNCIPIHVPTAVKSGDSFSLVSPQGPKFTIEFRELPPEEVKIRQESIARKKGLSGRNRLSKDSMAAEAKRQAWTSLLVSGPAQLAQRAVVFVKSGAIYQPRNIFLGLTLIGGYLFGGFTACRSKKVQTQLTTTKTEYKQCQESNEYLKKLQEDNDYSFETIALMLTTPELSEAIAKDSTIRNLVKKEAQYLFEENYTSNEYKWIIGKNNGLRENYRRWTTAIVQEESDVFDDATKKLLMWLPPIKYDQNKDFGITSNSEKKPVCGRGLLSLSYRQAQNLGMSAQPDAVFEGKETQVSTENKRNEKLLTSVAEYKLDPNLLPPYYQELEEGAELPEAPETSWQKVKRNTYCVHQAGSDDRESRGKIIKTLKKQYNQPDMEQANSIAKIARIFAADIPEENYSSSKNTSALKYKDKIGTSLARSELFGQEWVAKRTARVIARSLVIPCIITLKGTDKVKEAFFDENNPAPNPVMCFALSWRLTEDNN